MNGRAHAHRLLIALLISLALAGCGSTVQMQSTRTDQGNSGLGTSDGGLAPGSSPLPGGIGTSAPGGTSAGGSTPLGSTGGVAAPSLGPSQAGGPAAGPSGGVASAGAQSGFGFDAKTAYVGVEYVGDADAFTGSAGFSSITTGDDKALVETMLRDINAHGGVLGRKIVAVFHNTDAVAGSSNPASTAQAVCSDFTQDHRVFAAVLNSPAQKCLAQKKVASASSTNLVTDDTALRATAPYFRRPVAFSYTHLVPLWVTRLVAQGYLTKTSKVGILWPDNDGTGAGQRVKDQLKSELSKRGYTVSRDFGFDGSSAGAGPTSVPNAVLPFRSAGVDRVIALDASVAYFMINAQQQGYHPRYALNSYQNLASVQQSIPPKEQLAGAVGVGWAGINDVDPARLDVKPAGYDTCQRYIKASNQNPSGAALFILTSYCDNLRLFLYAAEKGGGFSPEAIRRGLAIAGTSFPSALIAAPAFSDTRMDGARGARDIRYDTGCSCFRYGSKTLYY